jgi:hypothetical protein
MPSTLTQSRHVVQPVASLLRLAAGQLVAAALVSLVNRAQVLDGVVQSVEMDEDFVVDLCGLFDARYKLLDVALEHGRVLSQVAQ